MSLTKEQKKIVNSVWYQKNKEKQKSDKKEYYKKNKQQKIEYANKRHQNIKDHALSSLEKRQISDPHLWHLYCNIIKNVANTNNKPYSKDFTDDIMFDMMIKDCFYCGDIASTIDRIDSNLDHTLENCVASCYGCNKSKGVADATTFIRKAYYRSRGEYLDDGTDIWFSHKNKPRLDMYRKSADKKGVMFELTKEDFGALVKGDCKYCRRSPTTWFGIDRVIPSQGYVVDNVVPCCWDCNVDKLEGDVVTMTKRNKRISDRVDTGEFVFVECPKVLLSQGSQPSSKKVCVYGNVYDNMSEASRALGKCDNYVCRCIRDGRNPDEIFEVSDQFL